MIRSSNRKDHRRPAAAAVEAALVLPFVALFLVAIVDLGRLARISDSLANAARNGAQYASANTTAAGDSVSIRSAAVAEMGGLPSVTSSNPTVTATQLTVSGTNFIKVTVSYNMNGTALFNVFSVPTMSSTVQMPMMPQ